MDAHPAAHSAAQPVAHSAAPLTSPPARTRRDLWEPLLLKAPTGLRAARAQWEPVVLRRRQLSALGLLVVFLALQFLIPARLVIGGLGAVGRPSVAVGLMVGFLWLVSAIRAHQLPPGFQPIRWVIGGYVALQLLGYAVGYDRLPTPDEASSADRWLIFTVAMAGVALATADGMRTRRDLDRLLQAFVGFAALMALIGALQFAEIIDLTQYVKLPGLRTNSDLIGVGARGDGNFPRVAGTANHYIEFGVVLALALPVALHYALFSAPGRLRVVRWGAVGLIASGIPFSISRSAMLTVVVAIVLLATIWPWRQRYNALVIGVLATGVFHLVNRGVLGTIKGLFINVDNDPSVQDRLARTGYVMDLWALRPWLGRGAGMVIPERYILLDNQLYMTLIAGGVVGLAGLVLFFVVPYLMARSTRLRGADPETRHLAQALAVILPASLLASGTFDSFSFATFVGVLFLAIGAIGALWRLDGTSVSTPIQAELPGERFVTTPLMANVRERIRTAWAQPRQDKLASTSASR